ncbi:protein FAM184A isoform X2 [Stegostoma tigrinum]|uniref:protein FAM184A isoform X2 n=1 Tax=Stegostoma tigrinum TaxID=3053191 RepID=UPI00287008B8|nr:protein FAM184A isoform X2 [Stegostoma tigrinum]
MATGVSWQQHYSGGAAKAGPAGGQAGGAAQYNQELHLKMSKKIAQLTKVIYALNTKNDEHEIAIQALKEAHEEEIQQIFDETKEKILYYKDKIDRETELQKRIQSLEASLEQHEQMKQQALAEFEAYKQQVEEARLATETHQLQGVAIMSRNIQEIKENFDDKLQHFIQLETQLGENQQQTVEDLQAAHKLEIQNLLRTHHNQHEISSKQQEKTQQLLKDELTAANTKIQDLTLEKQKLVEEFEAKLSKAQAFYEHEIEALNSRHSSENLLQWKKRETQLKREFQIQEIDLKKALDELQAELQLTQEDANEMRNKCEQFQEALNKAENNVQMLQQQLEDSQQKADGTLAKQKQLEDELVACKHHIQQQSTELLLKTSQIGTLQATQLTFEATIRELESQHCRLKERLSHVEEEKSILQDNHQTLDDQQRQQLLTVEKSLNEEKETQRRYYEEEIENLQFKLEEETRYLRETLRTSMEELSQIHQSTLESAQDTHEREKKKLRLEMDQNLEKERLRMEDEKNQLKQQMENLREELTAKLNTANQEVYRLQELVKKSEQGLGSAEGHISSLKDAQERLQKDLDSTRVKLRETSDSLSTVQGELDQQRQDYEARLTEAKEEEKLKLKKLEKDLEQKWKATIREQQAKLCEELEKQHEEEKRSALAQLSHLKDQENSVEKEVWQKKVEDLLSQRHFLGEALEKSISNISLLKQSLEMQLSQSQDSLQNLQCQFNRERQRLTQQMEGMEEEHKRKLASMEDAHRIALRNMEESKDRECKQLEESLNQQHMIDMQAQKDAERMNLEALQKEAKQQLQELRVELQDEGKLLLASLRSDLNYQHSVAMDKLRQNNQQEMAAVRMELDQTVEQHRQQKKELLSRISNLQEEVRHCEDHIKELNEESLSMHNNLSTLTKELEYKGNEVLKIRSEVNQKIRTYEQEMVKKQEKMINEMTATHIRETQCMLADFNKAQDLLKDKISSLEILLEEAEEKYSNRESRAEDLQLITELKEMITERDQLAKKLMDDKKFYQLELVNRETNFNKVFNASPNVGVINPLAKKKKNERIANRFVSAPNLSALESAGGGNGQHQHNRLEPIPNSPVHDIGLNSNKPLPQTIPPKEAKRFQSPPQLETTPGTEPSSDPQHEEWFARYFTF